jgi:surface polysaccharide O-acyltransferase-like enzyme
MSPSVGQIPTRAAADLKGERMSATPASPTARAVPKLRSTLSDRIRIGRTLCIFCMTFVHVQPGIADNVYDRDAGAFDIFYFLITRIVGLSAVSLLSLVSGYLVVSTFGKLGTGKLYASKFQTLVVPLFAWNAVMLALLLAYAGLSGNWRDVPEATPLGIANALFAITQWPVVVPLWFLRDLFVCVLFVPVLLFGLKRQPLLVMGALVAFTLFGEEMLIMQRPSLLLFFGIGMWVRVAGHDEAAIDRIARPLAWGLVAMVAVYLTIRIERVSIAEMDESLRISLDCLLRITMAAAFWRLTELVRRSSFAGVATWLEPYTFVIFCSHAILFQFGGIAFRPLFGNYGAELFWVTFVTLPLLAVVGAVAGLQAIAWSKPLLYLFNAGHGVPPLVRRAAVEPGRA